MANQKGKGNRITDVAKLAKVSQATVSRVFNKHPYVREDVRNRVIQAARSLNYAPKSTRAKNAFGIMVRGDVAMTLGAYETQLISGLSREFIKRGYNTEITTDQQMSLFHSNTFQALIILTSDIDEHITELGLPVVTVNSPIKKVPSVATDHFQGIALAVEHLIENGHEEIAFISSSPNNWGEKERIRGYKETLKAHGIKFNKRLHQIAKQQEIIEETNRALQEGATAIILSGEGRAQRLSHALSILGKKIPDDISIITFEDESVTSFLTPPHTTIAQNTSLFAKAIADMAIKLTKKEDIPQNIVLKNDLILRDTVKKLN